MHTPVKIRTSHGLSIVELMVAAAIGVIILIGVVTLFSNNKRTYVEVEQFGRLQENIRFAMTHIMNDARLANYKGCRHDADLPNGDAAIMGVEGGASSDEFTLRHITATPLRANDPDDPNDPSDSVSVITFDGSSNTVEVPQPHSIKAGSTIVIQNCNAVESFIVSAIAEDSPAAGTDTLTLNAAPPSTLDGSDISGYIVSRYHIKTSGCTDGEGNVVTSLALNDECLLSGVENMQVLYGEDTAGNDAIADTYVAADAVTDWQRVVSMKVALLFATEDYNIEPDTSTYDLLGTTIDPSNDNRRRKVASATIQMRNRLAPF